MSKARLKPILILMLAAAVCVAVFCCAQFGAADGVCAAQQKPSFTIATEDGSIWRLLKDSEEISRFEGVFFDPTSEDAASVVFKRAIDSVMSEADTDGYNLQFDLPAIGYSQQGSTAFSYSDSNSSFVLKGVYTPVISTSVHEALQYKKDGGDFVNYNLAEQRDGGLAFGQLVDVGEYQVRFVVYEIFTFDRVNYSVPRYSFSTACQITQATPQAPDIEEIEVEYGTKAGDMALALPSDGCRWSLSDGQTDDAITGADVRPHVKERAYTVLFDYTPTNPNYRTLKGVAVDVKVCPKTIRVKIADAYSLVGEDMVDIAHYEIATPLVQGDSEDGLGISIVCNGFDKLTAGSYIITASFTNNDYVPQSVNYSNPFLNGGRYAVYATRNQVTAPDGTVFYVLLADGFRDVTVSVNMYAEQSADNLQFVAAYEFVFERFSQRVYPEDGFAVEWDDDMIVASHVAFVHKDGSVSALSVLRDVGVGVDKDVIALAFFSDVTSPSGDSAKETACIVLASLCGVLGAALVVLATVYIKRRRYFV